MSDDPLPQFDPDAVRALLRPSPARRAMSVAVLGALGGLLFWIALTQQAGLVWLLVFAAAGAAAIWSASVVWRATRTGLVLSRDGLREDGGRLLAGLDEIVAVDRGTFAFKPSNGFLLRLAQRGPAGWSPGLWWRLGRRLGIGGVTSSVEAKAMADALAVLIAHRDGRL